MIADAVMCTHNGTGGAGALTLAPITGFPQPSDVLGTSGTCLAWMEIAEFTDSTKTVLSKYEKGIYSLVLSTGVVSRNTILTTWVSGSPGTYNFSNPTALTFGNTAANISIFMTASEATQKLGLPYIQNINGDGWFPFNSRCTYNSNVAARALITGNTNFWIVDYAGCGFITQVAVDVTANVGASTLRVGMYDILPGTGGPGNLLTEFTSGGTIATTANGFRAVTPATPFRRPPGFYYMAMAGSSSSVQLNCLEVQGNGLNGSSSSRDIMFNDKSITYGALAATGPTSWSNLYSRSSGNQWGVFYK